METFEHIYVINLPRSVGRREHITRLLEEQLALSSAEWSFAPSVDCAAYGLWQGVPLLHEHERETRAGNQSVFWMRQRPCGRSLGPPDCHHPQFSECLRPGADGVGRCKYVCYTLSVASALHGFLHSNYSRMLLLEDDVCVTSALADSEPLLRGLRASKHRTHGWDVAKLGGCHPCDGAEDDDTLVDGYAKCWEHPSERPSMTFPLSSPNEIKKTLDKTFCAHALALSRRGAELMLRLAFPVSAVFDDVLMLLGGGFGAGAQKAAIEFLSLGSEGELHAYHTKYSLFSQWSRQRRTQPVGLGKIKCPVPPCDKETKHEEEFPETWKRHWSACPT